MRMDEQPQAKTASKDAPRPMKAPQAKASKPQDAGNAAMGNAFAAALAKLKK
jgi:uncharacterized protein